jgi:hypothetical protein
MGTNKEWTSWLPAYRGVLVGYQIYQQACSTTTLYMAIVVHCRMLGVPCFAPPNGDWVHIQPGRPSVPVTLQLHAEPQPERSHASRHKPPEAYCGDGSAPELPLPTASFPVSRVMVAEEQQGAAINVHALHPVQDAGIVAEISQQLFMISW